MKLSLRRKVRLALAVVQVATGFLALRYDDLPPAVRAMVFVLTLAVLFDAASVVWTTKTKG